MRSFTLPDGDFELDQSVDVTEAILAIITRHPMRQDELERTLGSWKQGEIEQTLRVLEASGRARTITRYGVLFWSASNSYYENGG